jgi:hypothetical protein
MLKMHLSEITYTYWSVGIAVKSGGDPINEFFDKSLQDVNCYLVFIIYIQRICMQTQTLQWNYEMLLTS